MIDSNASSFSFPFSQHLDTATATLQRNRSKACKKLFVGAIISLIAAYNIAFAEIGEVSIDGEVVDPMLFQAYQNVILPDPDYCHPHTDTYVIDKVLERLLIRNAGREQALVRAEEVTLMEEGVQEELELLGENASSSQRDNLVLSLLALESDGYERELLNAEKPEIGKTYLTMLAANDPLVVNVTLLRTATLAFNSLIDAQEAKKRLITEEPVDDIARDLNLGTYLYEEGKALWRHASSMPSQPQDVGIKADAILGPYFSNSQWEVHKVLETKKLPVALRNDVIDGKYNTVSSTIRTNIKSQNRKRLIKALRADANVQINGKPSPDPAELNHCVETVF